ncbi:MAG TPA: PH domain-containing protein [Bacillota bacterium]|nr:PH domain-containing protein [Bacillota bacterium]
MRDDIRKALAKNKELNRLFSTITFRGMLRGIEGHLKSDEVVLYIRNSNVQVDNPDKLKPNAFSIKGKQPALMAVTDRRVLVYHKILFNEKVDQLPLQEIRSYDFRRDMFSSKVRISSITKSIDIDLTCNAKEVQYLNSILEEVTRKTTL